MCKNFKCIDCNLINSLFSSDFKNTGKILYLLGNYYKSILYNYNYNYNYYYDYNLSKKYYLMAIEKGNSDAMNSLGYHYFMKNNDLTKYYLLMAIDKGNVEALYNLGLYYEQKEKNYDLMKKYYLLYYKYDKHNKHISYLIDLYFYYTKDIYKFL